MHDKVVYYCGPENTRSLLNWILREFKKNVRVKQFDDPTTLLADLQEAALSDVLILDAGALRDSVLDYTTVLHNKAPSLKTILIVFPKSKDEIVAIIRSNVVKGIIVKPFTAEVVCRYLDKLL